MKVLWFSNTPSLAEKNLKSSIKGGGWIKSLEQEIKKQSDIELGVAFYYNKKIDYFNSDGTYYFPIYSGKDNKLKRFLKRLKGEIDIQKDIKYYLEIIDFYKPDVIHIHGTEMPFGLVQKYINIPTVISIQGNLNVCSYKFFQGISKEFIKRQTKIWDRILLKDYINVYKSFVKKAEIEKDILKNTKFIIGRTNWDYRITRVLAKNSKYFHLDEILRDDFYKFRWENNLKNKIRLFTTNGTSLYKGIETVLYAAHLLDDFGLNYEWKIAGINKNDSIIQLALKSQGIRLSPNIKLIGYKDEKELIKELLNTHIYIMPSHIENSPNNLCEALILGVPSIATCAGGTSSLISDRESGLLIQDGDPWTLIGAILELLDKYELAKKYGSNARERAIERHNKRKITKELLNIYSGIANKINK